MTRLKQHGTNRRTDTMGNRLVDFTVVLRQEDLDQLAGFSVRDDEPMSLVIRRALWRWIERDGA